MTGRRFGRGRFGSRLLLRALRSAFEGLVAFGGLCVYAPILLPGDWAAAQLSERAERVERAKAAAQPVRLTGPPPRHPERLRPDVPLTSSERWFRLQMQHLDPLLPADNG